MVIAAFSDDVLYNSSIQFVLRANVIFLSFLFSAHDWLLNLTVSLQRSAHHFSLYKDHQHYSYFYSHELSQMSHINQAVMMSETLMETVRPLMMKIRLAGRRNNKM